MNNEDWKQFLDSIDPLDDYGFHKPKPGEQVGDEIARLELNLAYYREFMKNKSKFPQDVHEARMADLERLRKIRKPIEYGLNDAQRKRLQDMKVKNPVDSGESTGLM